MSVLQGLAHHLQHIPSKLGEFVQEEDAAVGQRDLAWLGMRAAAQEAAVADRVVGGAEGAARDERDAAFEFTRDRMDARHLQGFLGRQGREDGGDATRKHRLSRAGGSDEEEVVPPGDGDLDGPLRAFLPLDVRKVLTAVPVVVHECPDVGEDGFEGAGSRKEVNRLA